MDYRIIRSGRRSLALEITRGGEVLVRAPRRVPDEAVRRFVGQHGAWIEKNLARVRGRLERRPEPDEAEAARLRALAKAVLPEKVARWADRMGVRPTRLTVTSARTRFGSCSAKNAVSFSWRLMDYPDEAVEYVVVHELAHILHHDHSPAFYACVERYLPDYRERKKLLRD
jgi:predicted metal-dependent hydrolase